MTNTITIKYFHPQLKIGLEDIKNAWLLITNEPIKLKTVIRQGNLYFRLPGSGKRISYSSIKKGLVKKIIIIKHPLNLLPF